MFERTKTISGKKRRYLVESYREGGKVRQRTLFYIDLWPERDVARLKKLYKLMKMYEANATRNNTKAYKDKAKKLANDVAGKIDRLYATMTVTLAPKRQREDGRRLQKAGRRRQAARASKTKDRREELLWKILSADSAVYWALMEAPIDQWEKSRLQGVVENSKRLRKLLADAVRLYSDHEM